MTDLILTLMIALITVALIPTVINQFRTKASTVPLTTSIPSVIALIGILGVYISQEWWLSAGIIVFNWVLWVILLFQRWRYDTEIKWKPLLRDPATQAYIELQQKILGIGNSEALREEDSSMPRDIWDNKVDAVYDDLKCPSCAVTLAPRVEHADDCDAIIHWV